jgi:hypothetical protein
LKFFNKVFSIRRSESDFFLDFLKIIKEIINKEFLVKYGAIYFISEVYIVSKIDRIFDDFEYFIFEIFKCALNNNFFSVNNIIKLDKFIAFSKSFNIFKFFFILENFYIFNHFFNLFRVYINIFYHQKG